MEQWISGCYKLKAQASLVPRPCEGAKDVFCSFTRPGDEARAYRRPTFIKCKDAINANANFPPDFQLLETQSTYYVRGDKSRQAQNAIIEFTISLKLRKHNLFTTHYVGLRYIAGSLNIQYTVWRVS